MSWEKEFDEKMEHPMHQDTSSFTKAAMRLFIRQALDSQMSDLRKEVEKKKQARTSTDSQGTFFQKEGYNAAIDEVLLLMKKK